MNNYSWLQKKFHQTALSSKFIRETTFDIESLFIPYQKNIEDKHVFVAGLARSGSTILLNAIYDSNLFASLSYLDMPFILAPNLWKKLSKKNINYNKLIERSHKDGIKISINSPEAFEEVFWKTFENSEDSKKKFERFINLVTYKYKRKRYLSKNNQNIRRVKYLSSIFPNSKILIPFRDPLQQATSLLLQHNRFIEYFNNRPLKLRCFDEEELKNIFYKYNLNIVANESISLFPSLLTIGKKKSLIKGIDHNYYKIKKIKKSFDYFSNKNGIAKHKLWVLKKH